MRALAALVTVCLIAACSSSSGGALSKKAPNDVLTLSAAALRTTHSYHVKGMLDPDYTIDVVVVPNGSSGTLTTHGLTWQETTVAGQVWFRGRALWQRTLPKRAAEFGDKWVQINDLQAGYGFARSVVHLELSLPDIVFGPQKGLKNNGVIALQGQRVVDMTSDEDIYDVLADQPHYPVRWLEKENPGPNGQPCGITLDRFNAPAAVQAPVTSLVL